MYRGVIVSEGISHQKEQELPWGQNSEAKIRKTRGQRRKENRESERERENQISLSKRS
jgi:hypothetical protein